MMEFVPQRKTFTVLANADSHSVANLDGIPQIGEPWSKDMLEWTAWQVDLQEGPPDATGVSEWTVEVTYQRAAA